MSENKMSYSNDELLELRIREYEEKFSNASLIEDLKFREIAKSKEGKNMLNGLTKEFYEVAKKDGLEQGIDQGKITVLIDLLSSRIISEEVVMNKLNITKEELDKLIKSQGIDTNNS